MAEFFFVALILAGVLFWWWSARRSDQRWMPREIQRGTLVYAETRFRAPGPVVLSARVDRAYRVAGNQLVLVELKTRRINRTYLSDVIELSAQRVAIMRQTGEPVLTRAYVVVDVQGGRRVSHKVELMDDNEVDALIVRRQAVLDGHIEPRRTCVRQLCRKCEFSKECWTSCCCVSRLS